MWMCDLITKISSIRSAPTALNKYIWQYAGWGNKFYINWRKLQFIELEVTDILYGMIVLSKHEPIQYFDH